uniref:Uncharacterized protein n=1 Tax=Avena sativa TaxID=4498 RepID=A0ACD5WUJ0_AVESA
MASSELLERRTFKATTSYSNGPAHAADEATGVTDDDEELTEQHDLVRLLPHDVIADVFGRVPLRLQGLARRHRCPPPPARGPAPSLVSRHICPLLLPQAPRTLGPSLLQGHRRNHRQFPNTDTSIKATDPCITDYDIEDHCNGLLLLGKYVLNPATWRWVPSPPCPPYLHHVVVHTEDYAGTTFSKYLALDPTVSPH